MTITDSEIRNAIEIAQGQTECVEQRAIAILHQQNGSQACHAEDVEARVRAILTEDEDLAGEFLAGFGLG